MQRTDSDLRDALKLGAMGAFLLALIFFTPNTGQGQQESSFFAVALNSAWGNWLDWPAIWCSAKIILLSIAILLVLDAVLSLMIRNENPLAGMAVLTSAIFPLLLGFFGLYQLVKAVL